MDQEIALAINRALFHQKAPASILITNAKRHDGGTIMAITHLDASAVMVLIYRDFIVTAAITLDNGLIDVQANESWQQLKIHAVPLVWYMGIGTEGQQKMQYGIHAENKVIAIPV
jgi:hypothetical protein